MLEWKLKELNLKYLTDYEKKKKNSLKKILTDILISDHSICHKILATVFKVNGQ